MNNKLILKKAHIPLKSCLKIAFKNIYKKKFRFLLVIIITAISLAFLSFTIELNGDKLRQNVYTMIENGYRYTTIEEYSPLDGESEKLSYYNKYNAVPLSENSYSLLKTKMPELTIHLYEGVYINYANMNIENANFFYTGYIDNIILYDDSNTYQLLAGKLPTPNTNEILITDYLVAAFQHFGLYSDCKTYYDFINQYLDLTVNKNYKIVGIIDTPYERWSHFMRETEINETNKANYSFINDFAMMNAVVLNEKYFKVEKEYVSKNQLLNNDDYFIDVSTTYGTIDSLSALDIQYENLQLCSRRGYGGQTMGNNPTNDDQIIIPATWTEKLFGYTYSRYDWNFLWQFDEYILNKPVTLTIKPRGTDITYTKTFKVAGITTTENAIQITEAMYYDYRNDIKNTTEKIIVELPTSASKAFSYFQKAFSLNYVIDVWKYRNDIDSYTIDPFINIISKAGLFVFIVFAMGIMWTIMSIEIVDSKKEIGILRSIGLSGIKVSLIFIIQALFVNLCSYGLALFISSRVIPWYNSGIKDELNVITLYLYNFTYRSPLYLIIFVIIMTLVSTIIPLYKITTQKIIDVINERE